MSLLIFRAPERAMTPGPVPDTPQKALRGQRANDVFTQAKQNPYGQLFNRLLNPDPTLQRFDRGEGLDLYFRIRRQITALSGICGQLVDGALKRRPCVVAGDMSDSESVRVADEVRSVWDDIPEKPVVLRAGLDNVVTCGFAPIENVWGRHSSGIVAPVKLVDRPPRNIIFTLDEIPRFITPFDPIEGEAIDPLKFIFLRGGTTNTPYGQSVFVDLHSAAWLYQQVQNFAMDALEKFGRPNPHVNIPRYYTPENVADLDNFYTEKFGTFTRGFYDGDKVTIEYPAMPMASSGAAGRAELEFMKFLEGQMYILILRTQQTQNTSGGSRATEQVRFQITDLATVTYSDILCDGLQSGWMKPVCDINYPSLDAKLRPRFIPDPTGAEDKDKLHARMIAGIDRGISYSKQQYYRNFGLQEAKDTDDVLGHPLTRITETVPAATPPVPNDPTADDAQDGEGEGGDPGSGDQQPGATTLSLKTDSGETFQLPAVVLELTRTSK